VGNETVTVDDEFDEFDSEKYSAALYAAWDRLQKGDAMLTDCEDEDERVDRIKDEKRGLYPDKIDPAN
jgi:hypothetical protein